MNGTRSARLKDDFFDVPCIQLAKNLLGTILTRYFDDGTVLRGKIVETECYLGGEDKASHSYNGRRTPGNEPMYTKPGSMYVYFTYGMYHCFNISSQGDGAAVLIRAVEPLEGIEYMRDARTEYGRKRKKKTSQSEVKIRLHKVHELCNGPSKLCISFAIDKDTCNKEDITTFKYMWIEPRMDDIGENDIITSKRVGIDSAGEIWANKLLRFYIYGNNSVSKIDKKQEMLRIKEL